MSACDRRPTASSSFVSTQPSNSLDGSIKDGLSTDRSLPPGRHKTVSKKDAINCDETETLLNTPDRTDTPTSRHSDDIARVSQVASGGGDGGGYFPVPPIQLFGGREERRPTETTSRVAGSAPTRLKTRRLRDPHEKPLAFPHSETSDRKSVTVASSSTEIVALTKLLSTVCHTQPQQPRAPFTSGLRVAESADGESDASRTQPAHIASEEEDDDDDNEEYDSTLSPSTCSSIQPHRSSLRVAANTDSPPLFSVTSQELRHDSIATSPDPLPTPSSSCSWSALQPDRDSQDNLVLEASLGCIGSVYPSFNMAVSMSLSPVDSAPLAPSGEQSTIDTPSGEYSTPSGEDFTLRVGLEHVEETTTSTTTNKDISHSSSSAPATTELLDNIINNNNGH